MDLYQARLSFEGWRWWDWYNNNVEDPEIVERIFDDVGNIDYIYQVIQECVDEVTEEQVMLQQKELAEVEWKQRQQLIGSKLQQTRDIYPS